MSYTVHGMLNTTKSKWPDDQTALAAERVYAMRVQRIVIVQYDVFRRQTLEPSTDNEQHATRMALAPHAV